MSDYRGPHDLDRQRWGQMGRTFITRTMGGVGSWLKAQVILFFVSLVILAIGLALIGISWWGLKALLVAFIDLLPLVGSGIVMIPWAILKLIGGEGQQALWLIILYIVLVIVRQIAEPLIVGKSIGVKPLWTFLATVIGALALGPFGAILGSLAAIVIRVALSVWEEFNPRPGRSGPGSYTGPGGPSGTGGSRPSGGSAGPREEDPNPAPGPVDPRRYRRAKDAGSDETDRR